MWARTTRFPSGCSSSCRSTTSSTTNRAVVRRSAGPFLALSGERFTAAEALRLGLVHAVYPASAIEAALASIVEALLLGAPGAIAALKATAARIAAPPITEALLRELEAGSAGMLQTPEAREGVASFLEKRKPGWYPQE